MRAHLASLVEDMRRSGDETALVWYAGVRQRQASYRNVARLAGRFAAELDLRGIGPGERVVIWGENSAAWVGVFFGCLLRGVLVVPLDAAGSPRFAERVLNDVRPKLVVADDLRWRSVPGETTEWPRIALERLLVADSEPGAEADGLPDEPNYSVADSVTLDAPFQIVFTSGTTAEPKGIVHTHRNVLASVDPIEQELAKYRRYERWVHPLRMLHTLPLSHVFGQFMALWIAPILGAEVHLEPRIEPSRMLRRIRSERINMLVAVPRTLELLRAQLLVEDPALQQELATSEGMPAWKRWWVFRRIHRRLGLRFWALICGGASLSAELELFWGRLGLAVIQGYGMTETAALITLNHPFHLGRGTLGKPLPGREVKLSATGEILVRGATVSSATWHAGRIEAREGEWLATGDLATTDDTGALHFAGRQSETIVTANGLNVFPGDLEAVLLRQPNVSAAAVVSCQGVAGPEPVAVLVMNGDDAALDHALESANVELAAFQRIRRVLRWKNASLPFTATGKLLRREVAEWACAQLMHPAQNKSAAGTDSLLALVEQITSSHPPEVAGGTDALRFSEDLGLDSLGRVQMQALIEERFGISIDEERVAALRTIGDLRQAMNSVHGVAHPAESVRSESTPVRTLFGTAVATSTPLTGSRAEAPLAAPRLADRYPRWTWSAPVEALRSVFQETIARPLTWLLAAPRVMKLAPLRTDKPLLIVANHITTYDVPLILYGLPWPLRRRVAVAMSGELLRDYRSGRRAAVRWADPMMPLAYWLITVLFNVFPLPRFGGFRRSFEHAGAAMDHGYSVLVFPEGQRTQGDLQNFRAGIGLLAQETQADVLPVALAGLGALKTGRRRRWLRFGASEVRIGPVEHFTPDQTPDAIAAELEQTIRNLLRGH